MDNLSLASSRNQASYTRVFYCIKGEFYDLEYTKEKTVIYAFKKALQNILNRIAKLSIYLIILRTRENLPGKFSTYSGPVM